ncbi:uncharacterized protein N7511_008464 [Penicillium nucicola]|uniref:uncharacterized protein n=1 Tax=Penicillium nucicola TaxID=1850975 RepID=UPI002544DA14|nr:uncharacterized protein N7511_008464 [Penicillium nucicola]KAJ5751499.1 hypothetical protein N7511_008464 [Penicillium nucicola]
MTSKQQQQYALALYFDRTYGITGAIYQQFSDREFHDVSKRKFYRAVMGRLLDTKILQFATLCQRSASSNRLLQHIRSMWSGSSERTPEESLEILEAFDFISNFMLLHILRGPYTFVEWGLSLDSDEAREALLSDPNDTLLSNWVSLLPRLQLYLSPFDILAAFRMDELNSETSRYFASLLALSAHDQGPLGMGEIENEVSYKLEQEYHVAGHTWKTYRHHGWRTGARGAIFDARSSAKRIASEITRIKCDGRDWWTLIEQASNDAPVALDFRVPDDFLTIFSSFGESTDIDDIRFVITKENFSKLK